MYHPVLFFPPQEQVGTRVSSQLGSAVPEGKDHGALSFPTGFDVDGFALAHGAGASHLVPGFLTKGIGLCIMN